MFVCYLSDNYFRMAIPFYMRDYTNRSFLFDFLEYRVVNES